MGFKQIWDGEQLPPIGCEVLIHLASMDAWVPHEVTGISIRKTEEKHHYLIDVTVKPSADPRSGNNQRLLDDVRPVDWRPDAKTSSQG